MFQNRTSFSSKTLAASCVQGVKTLLTKIKKQEFIDYFSKLNLRDTKDIFVFWSMVNKVLKVPNKNRHFLYFQTNATNLSMADNVN